MKARTDQFNWRNRLARSADSHVRPPSPYDSVLHYSVLDTSRRPGFCTMHGNDRFRPYLASLVTCHSPLATSPARARKRGAKRCKKVQKSAIGLCSPLLNRSECPFSDDISGKFQFLSRYVTTCHVLSPLAPLSSPDSKWTKSIDFWSISVHFEIGSLSHSSLLSLGAGTSSLCAKLYRGEKVFW